MDTGLHHIVNSLAVGLFDAPSAAALWDFLQTGIPAYTADVVAEFRWAIVLAGMIGGFLIGLTGVGGGTLLTPLLIYLGIQPTVAVGSDLLYGSITKLVGAFQHSKRGSIDWSWVRYLAVGSVPASFAAVYLLSLVQTWYGSVEELVRFSLGGVLLFAALLSIGSEIYMRRRRHEPLGRLNPKDHAAKIILLGVVVGFMVGMTSLGSGAIVAVALLAVTRLPVTTVVGTDIAHALLLVSAAAFAHWQFGSVNVALAANLLVGSLPGVILGSRLAYRTPARPLKFGTTLLILAGALKMIRVI